MEALIRAAQLACGAAVRAGADFADASVERGRTTVVSIEKNAIKSCDSRLWVALSVRAFSRGATGWSTVSGFADPSARRAGREAAELARSAEPDPEFIDLARPAAYPDVPGLYDPALAALPPAAVAGWLTANIDQARQVAPEALVSGNAHATSREWALVNNLGVQVSQRSTNGSVTLRVVVRRGEEVGSFYEWDAARARDQLTPEGMGAKAATEALRYLDSRTMRTATLPVILGPLAASSFLHGLCAAASAEEVQRNRSFLAGRRGERVAAECLTLVDDPLLAGGLSSGLSDGDGCPHQRLTLVEEGVLQTYLHSHYTAQKTGERNTAHSTRGGIAPTNIIPRLGSHTEAELIAGVSDGLYVTLARPQPDTASGQVSALVDAGFRIRNGELAYPLKNTMIAGHGLEMLRRVEAVSSDYRAEPGRVLPSLRLHGVRVASEA